MRIAYWNRFPVGVLLLAMCLPLPGCVFDKMLKNMEATSAKLDRMNGTLFEIEQQLEEVQRTNELLIELQAGLGTSALPLEPGDPERVSIIATLKSINALLAKLDQHLASLTGTIQNIDNAIPFLKFAAEEEEPPAEGEGAEGVEGEVPANDVLDQPATPTTGGTAPKR